MAAYFLYDYNFLARLLHNIQWSLLMTHTWSGSIPCLCNQQRQAELVFRNILQSYHQYWVLILNKTADTYKHRIHLNPY